MRKAVKKTAKKAPAKRNTKALRWVKGDNGQAAQSKTQPLNYRIEKSGDIFGLTVTLQSGQTGGTFWVKDQSTAELVATLIDEQRLYL